ncbi:dihydrolipoyl dehydrogenase [Nitzschia inconspicua]|uniref:Dihydrolipoyl dehydrogenase n=1 Tax=Nitzschia inconspicua TaxID=303405 RepID=A0A9K3KQE0_9STRA|nr:dihydrolipoyl dehydrogenase [Nitzschia inconspicua]
MNFSKTDFDKDLDEIAEKFKNNIKLLDRSYRLKTYKQCFVGSEAVDYLVQSGATANREDAVLLGNAFLEMHLIEHVLRDHPFKDDYLFYRFVGENERGNYSIDETTGESIKWDNFLGAVEKVQDESLQPRLPQPDFESLNPKDQHVAKHVWPMDKYNTVLLNYVHPPEWKDPNPNKKDGSSTYDLVVIGAGVGGLITAAGSAGIGAKVAMIEENLLGGDCLNVGCVPSKAFIHCANMAYSVKGDTKRLEEAGIFVNPETVKVDFEKVMERVRKIRAEISQHDSAERYSAELGVEVYIGRGKFTSEKSVIVNGRTLYFKRAVIATGGYPILIPMTGLKELHERSISVDPTDEPRPIVTTNETFFNMTKQPKNMVVIGAGVIGMELAQSMQRLGTHVTVLGRSGKILPKEDEDMAELVKTQMIRDGVSFNLSIAEYKTIKLTGRVLDNGYPEMEMTFVEKGKAGETKLIFDSLLIAAGRRPNVTGMELELAKVDFDTKRGLLVNDKLQTTNPRIYGVGDCCSEFKFTHAADFMARTVIRNALFFGKGKMSDLLIPYATFTTPEIASVGLYGKDLEERGIEYRVFEKHFKDNDRSICDDTKEGFIRFRVDAKKDTILGCSIVGEGAGNMIGEVTLAMQSSTGLGSLASVIHPYPTTSEAIRQAGDAYNKTKLTTTVKSLLRGIVKFQS